MSDIIILDLVLRAFFVMAVIYAAFRLLMVMAVWVLRVLAYYHAHLAVELLKRAKEQEQIFVDTKEEKG